ncbi:hypothetical protein rosag_28310 [Roseisolibacter agri]|uniref:Uncharacterized protein n=1 Tax=Roseisolibacter agri TaxID=2014610 RepID=A0AA37QIB4_9BACT|nr:hypothetical protein rosag_28310 [Roseisolibacter agri]
MFLSQPRVRRATFKAGPAAGGAGRDRQAADLVRKSRWIRNLAVFARVLNRSAAWPAAQGARTVTGTAVQYALSATAIARTCV